MRQLLGEPVAMFGEEPLARHQARAWGERQAGSALVDTELESARTRIADALDFDAAAVGERERQRVAFDRAWPGSKEAANHVRATRDWFIGREL